MSLKFQQRPLAEVIKYLGKIAQVPMYLDPKGMAAEGVSSDTPVTIDLSQDISLKSALKLILEPLRLTYMINDEVLKITSEDMRHGAVVFSDVSGGRPGDSDSEFRAGRPGRHQCGHA